MIAELAPFGGELAQSSILMESEEKMRRALREVAKEADATADPGAAPAAGEREPGA
jgi:hypothetical protein